MPAPPALPRFELNYYGTQKAVDAFRANLEEFYAEKDVEKTYNRQTVSPDVTRVVQTLKIRYGDSVLPYFNNSLMLSHIHTPMTGCIDYAFVTYNQGESSFRSEVNMIVTPDPMMMRDAVYRNTLRTLLDKMDSEMLLGRFQKQKPVSHSGRKGPDRN